MITRAPAAILKSLTILGCCAVLVAAHTAEAAMARDLEQARTFVTQTISEMMQAKSEQEFFRQPWKKELPVDYLATIIVADRFEIIRLEYIETKPEIGDVYDGEIRFFAKKAVHPDQYAATICSVPLTARNERITIAGKQGRFRWVRHLPYPYVTREHLADCLDDDLVPKLREPIPECQ